MTGYLASRWPKDIGAQDEPVIHRDRHVPIDVHAVPCFRSMLHASNSCASINLREEASRRSFGSLDFVKRSVKWHPLARQRPQVRDPFHDHDSRAENYSVHREILGGEIWEPCAVFLKEIETDRLGVFGHRATRPTRRKERRLGEVVGRLPYILSVQSVRRRTMSLFFTLSAPPRLRSSMLVL